MRLLNVIKHWGKISAAPACEFPWQRIRRIALAHRIDSSVAIDQFNARGPALGSNALNLAEEQVEKFRGDAPGGIDRNRDPTKPLRVQARENKATLQVTAIWTGEGIIVSRILIALTPATR